MPTATYSERHHGLKECLVGSHDLVLCQRVVLRGVMVPITAKGQTVIVVGICPATHGIGWRLHAISDLAGIRQGFRDTNQWLALLANYVFSTSFYAGDDLGSFNSIMRLTTGLLSGLSITWPVFPYIFRSQALDQGLDRYSYGKVIEQIKN